MPVYYRRAVTSSTSSRGVTLSWRAEGIPASFQFNMDSVLRWRSGSKVSLGFLSAGQASFSSGWTGPIDPRIGFEPVWCQIRLCNRNIDGKKKKKKKTFEFSYGSRSFNLWTRRCERRRSLSLFLTLSLWIYRFIVMEIGIFRFEICFIYR